MSQQQENKGKHVHFSDMSQSVYGQKILPDTMPTGAAMARDTLREYMRDEFRPGGVEDPQGRKDLNEEYNKKRAIMEKIMVHEAEIVILKEEFAK
jgi:hypothetical protein